MSYRNGNRKDRPLLSFSILSLIFNLLDLLVKSTPNRTALPSYLNLPDRWISRCRYFASYKKYESVHVEVSSWRIFCFFACPSTVEIQISMQIPRTVFPSRRRRLVLGVCRTNFQMSKLKLPSTYARVEIIEFPQNASWNHTSTNSRIQTSWTPGQSSRTKSRPTSLLPVVPRTCEYITYDSH